MSKSPNSQQNRFARAYPHGSDYSPNDAAHDLDINTTLPGAQYGASSVDSYSGTPGSAQTFSNAFDIDMMGSPAGITSHPPHDPLQSPSRDTQHRSGHPTSHGRHRSLGNLESKSQTDGGIYGAGTSLSNDDNSKMEGVESQTHPQWSELKTKAGKERKRLPLACIACRRKKVRCSGDQPACKHCLRSRIPCVYKVTTRKAAPRTDYMAMLDKRLKRMEDRVIKIIPKNEQDIVHSTGRSAVRPPLPPPPPKSAGASKKRPANEAFGDEIDEWAAGPPAGTVGVLDPALEAKPDPLTTKDSDENTLLLEGADKLPPKDIQEHLAEVYFEYVYGQTYHLLHKPSFMRKLAQGTVPPVLVLAVCAISARFSTHPSLRTEPAFLRGEDWASTAREISLKRYDAPNITILIVYLLLGLHEFGTCQGGRSWMFGGMAQRMAYALQLHKDLDHEPKGRTAGTENEITFTDREIRRRTVWSCFIMDRFMRSTDRPIFVSEQYIRAQLPIKEEYFQMEITGPTEDLDGHVPNPVEPGTGVVADAKSNMGVAAFLVRLVSIYGTLITYQHQGGKEREEHPMWTDTSRWRWIKRAMQAWKNSLPASLEYTPDNLQNHHSEKIANQFLFLHIVYHQIQLFMHRFALPPPGTRPNFPEDMPEGFIADAAGIAVESANQISALVHEAMDHFVVAPFSGYAAFTSSTIHIYGAFSKDAELQASSKQNLAWNVKYLTKMKKYWGMFHFVTENLRDLYRRRADAARSGDKSGRESEVAIFQYGDWFDRYPNGVSGTDYEEPSVEIKKEPGADAVLGQKSDLQTVEEFFSRLSPPSQAAAQIRQQQQQQQPTQPQPKKTAAKKRRQSKLESNKSKPTPQGQQPAESQSNTITHDLANTYAFQDQANVFPPNFPPPLVGNPMQMPPQQQYLSQLDRQMVLDSYAGLDPNPALAHQNVQQQMQLGGPGVNLDHFDFDALQASGPNGGNGGNTGFWGGDPSAAWFMPFNMEPPAVGEAGEGLLGREFDWAGMPGFGDVGGMGLTPLPMADVEMGLPQQGGGGQLNLEGLDGMQQ